MALGNVNRVSPTCWCFEIGPQDVLTREEVWMCFLDLAKAFDKVPHKRQIEKLQKHRIGGRLKDVIESWLANRRQRVCIKGVMSGWMKVLSGVP